MQKLDDGQTQKPLTQTRMSCPSLFAVGEKTSSKVSRADLLIEKIPTQDYVDIPGKETDKTSHSRDVP